MNLRRALGLFLVVCGPLGCGMVAGQSSGGASTAGATATFEVPQAVKDRVRADEVRMDAVSDPVEDQEVAKQEKDVLHALAMSLGKEGPAAGMPPYESASQALAELRAAKFQLRIEPVSNGRGGNVGSGDFVQLKDSFTERVQALQGKLAAGTATASERAEVTSGAKQMMKLTGLRLQVTSVSQATMMTNVHVQNGGIATMLKVAGMVTARKQQSMEFTAEDYARVKRILTRQKHWEAMAAATMGMLAAYEAVVATPTADPKALDVLAEATLKAFPLDPQVSDDDAKDYVTHLGDDASAKKAKYEAMMRAAVGDAVYEAQYKTGIDNLFARASGAASTKSVSQLVTDTGSKYQADLAKCARGEPLDPGSLVGPGKCKEARDNAPAGGDSSGGAGGGGGKGNKVAAGLAVAGAAANGDAAGALQAAADMFPGDGPIQASLQGVAALTKGDFKGALKSAVGLASLIPGGSLVKEGLRAAGKLLGLFG
jgi:hypothetical protein